jgi:hypothetical protein
MGHPVWPKYPNALLCRRLRLYPIARFILNFTALSPILIIHESRLGKGERGMDWKKLLGSITTSVDEELQLRNAYLEAENRLPRQQITGRVPLTDDDRRTLAELGQKLGKQVLEEIATVAKPDTIRAWHRKFVDHKGDNSHPCTVVGRPRVDKEIEDLVVRMARENRAWGYDRMVGALANLGYTISDQTVGNILKRHSIPPAPARKKTTTWWEFIRIHMAVLQVTDFFTSAVWHWCGLVCLAVFCIPFGRCKVQVIRLAACLKTWCADWYDEAARWMHSMLEEGLSQLFAWRPHGPRLLLCKRVPQEHQPHLPHGMRKVCVLPLVDHRPIRDGPIRTRPELGGLLQNGDRAAA